MRLLVVVVLLLATCAAASVAQSPTKNLPLYGTTKRGQEWRLRAAKPTSGDDVPRSWCLNLGYTTGVVLNGKKYSGGLTTCGRRPARRISGMTLVDCERGAVFVFGALRRHVGNVRLRDRRGRKHRPTFAPLPTHSGFEGRTFIVVIDVSDLPGRLTADGAGQIPVARIPRRSDVCQPQPGAPKGGEPFADFASRT